MLHDACDSAGSPLSLSLHPDEASTASKPSTPSDGVFTSAQVTHLSRPPVKREGDGERRTRSLGAVVAGLAAAVAGHVLVSARRMVIAVVGRGRHVALARADAVVRDVAATAVVNAAARHQQARVQHPVAGLTVLPVAVQK